jgi:hypothetical protein
VAYQTAWTMAHKLRHGLSEDPARPLCGFLEADETFIGGRGDPTSRGRSTACDERQTPSPVDALQQIDPLKATCNSIIRRKSRACELLDTPTECG